MNNLIGKQYCKIFQDNIASNKLKYDKIPI